MGNTSFQKDNKNVDEHQNCSIMWALLIFIENLYIEYGHRKTLLL